MSAGVGRIRLRLMVENVELPVVGVVAQSGAGGPSIASIQVPPLDALHGLAPGSSVQVYYWDSRPRLWSMTSDARGYAYQALPAQDERRWRLLHNGIYQGYQSVRSRAGQWVTTLRSVSPLYFYNRLQQFTAGFQDGGPVRFDMEFLGIQAGQRQQRFLKDLADANAPTAIYNVIREGAKLYGDNWVTGLRFLLKKAAFNNHPFWETEYKRLRVGDQLVGFDHDRSSDQLFPAASFKKYVVDSLSQAGSLVSFRDVSNLILEMLAHSWWEPLAPHLSLGPVHLPGESGALVSGHDSIYVEGYPDAEMTSGYVLPDLWWACPPTCNVLFPDHYSELQTARDHYQEATRLFMHSDVDLRGQQWARQRHYAPRFDGMQGFFSKQNLPAEFNAKNATELLPWEELTGPISNFHIVDTVPSKTRTDALVAYLEHLANFDFWSVRLERTANLSGRFHPDPVPGLPAVVIRQWNRNIPDSEMPGSSGYVGKGATRLGKYPQALIGRIVQVVHSISQDSAFSSFALDHVRWHDEDFDLDGSTGDDLEGLINQRNKGDDALRFFGKSYDRENIGENVYQPLLGCTSILDYVGTHRAMTTQEAVDHLVRDYGLLQVDSDVQRAIDEVTSRPVADYPQVAGTGDVLRDDLPGYTRDGFLYSALTPRKERPGGVLRRLLRIKDDKAAVVDENQVAHGQAPSKGYTEDDPVWESIVTVNAKRREAATTAQEALAQRVHRG